MVPNRQDDRVFSYVRDILATQRRDTGVPVVFGLARVSNATTRFTDYLEYLLTGAEEPRTGELKRAVREMFEGNNNENIGDGTVPKLDGQSLTASQVAELAYHVMSLEERIPHSSHRNWLSDIIAWKSLFIEYNARHGDLWEGFKKSTLASHVSPVMWYRIFLLASGITNNTSQEPKTNGTATLPHTSSAIYDRFKAMVGRDGHALDRRIRAKIWRGFLDERNLHYLATGSRKPDRKPSSSETMLEMFECYFNCREYTYDRQGNCIGIAMTITKRYWPMMGTLAIGLFICAHTMIGGGALLLMLILWRYQRHSATSSLDPIQHWGPCRTVAYVVLCAFVGNSQMPLLAMITAVPVAVFAAHLNRKWGEIKAV